ncbi:MAG: ABC transporter ATP-binding protein [Clostridia bacterium]|nr:ABC transporter ATP-binding protein [Clostridia bacterium]
MSKHISVSEGKQLANLEHTKHENKIPDLEYLFRPSKDGNKKGEKSQDSFMSRIIKKDFWRMLYLCAIHIICDSPTWVFSLVTSDVINLITYKPEGFVLRIVLEALILFILILFNVPTNVLYSKILNGTIRSNTARIKSALIRKLQRLSITYHKEMEEGRISSKFIRDVDNVGMYHRIFLSTIITLIVDLLIAIGIALYRSPLVTLFFVLIIPLNVLFTFVFRKKIRKQSFEFRVHNEELSAKLTTTLQMMNIVKAHGLANVEGEIVDNKIHEVKDAALKLDNTNAYFAALIWSSSKIMAGVCLFFCVYLALNNVIKPGDVVLFQTLFNSISAYVLQLINVMPNIITGQEAVRSLSEIMSAEDIENDNGKKHVNAIKGKILFENVCYRYPNESKNVINNFNLSVNEGERIAVVGSSGSGKTTIMNLIIGLLSPTSGRIYLDGKPLDEISMQEYRHFISVVPQNSMLFSGTIKENITYGLPHYTEKEFNDAIEDSFITEFLPSFPNGINTMVGEHGDKLSGGQKQRISIARALIRNPKILILDEATSALDNVSEYHVQKAIDKLVNKRTTFIVAHRLSTIRNADRIVVMENGEIVEVGTYSELVELNGKFAELEKLSKMREDAIKKEMAV